MALDPSLCTALLLIDNQRGVDRNDTYYGDSTSNPKYEQNVAALLAAFRDVRKASNPDSVLIFHVAHASLDPRSPLHPDHPGSGTAFRLGLEPAQDEPVFWKHVNSAFIGTDLERALRDKRVQQLVVAGLTTDHCVSTSVRMAGNLGVVGDKGRLILAEDSTFAYGKFGYDAETLHGVSVATLRDEFAEVWKTADVVDGLKRFRHAT